MKLPNYVMSRALIALFCQFANLLEILLAKGKPSGRPSGPPMGPPMDPTPNTPSGPPSGF